MKITFTVSGWREYAEWAETDPAMVRKINGLIKECVRQPFKAPASRSRSNKNSKAIGHAGSIAITDLFTKLAARATRKC